MCVPPARLLILLLLLCASVASARAQDTALDVQVQRSSADGGQAFEPLPNPGWRSRVVSAAQPQARLRISPASGAWPQGEWVLQLRISPLHRVTLEVAGERWPSTRGLNPVPGLHAGHGDVAFLLHALPAAGAPLLVDIDARDSFASTMALRLLPAAEYEAANAAWLAYAGAMLAVMFTMAVMALMFAAYLRDSSFVWYAVYLLAYVWILGLQSAFLASPLGLTFATQGAPISGRIATATAIACAAMFLDRFAHLRRHAPRLRWALHVFAAVIVATSLMSLLPAPSLVQLGRSLTNPLIILGGPLLLFVALWAAVRGSRYALIFAFGWTPLLVVTVMSSLQVFGYFRDWPWLDNAAMAAGAFEALVLSAGLAYRSMELRRDRDSARRLADVDPLTGLLNRRAWSERVRQLMTSQSSPLSVLFIDLDHFKILNDRHGHDLGDRALASVASCLQKNIRPQDLLARHGGEELVAALPGCDLDTAMRLAEQLRERVGRVRVENVAPDANPIDPLTLSIGVAAQRLGETLESLVRRADAAMYAAKRAGRNRVEMDRNGVDGLDPRVIHH